MTLDEAIKHCEEVAEKNESEANFGFGNVCIDRSSCLECAKEHRQLATWLRELKACREAPQPIKRTEERTETHACDCISKTGHWEWVQYESKPNFGNWHCSECRCILCGGIKENPIRLPKYCPECGAKMQEVQK